nr:transposase, MuDR [Tanacetum cinerariifolium]
YSSDKIMYYQYMIPDHDLDNGLRALGQSNVNAVGESSVANEIGKNNVPSQFADDFYSALDNENFDPFYNLDDFGVLGRVNEIHHGGLFSDLPRRTYVNGIESFIDNVDIDLFYVIELNEMVLLIGYSSDKIMYYQYMIPDHDLDNGLRALGQSNVNAVGESSVANEIGKNNVPSQFADDFYSALDNENFDPFYNLDDFGVLGRVNESELSQFFHSDCDGVLKDKLVGPSQSNVNAVGESSVANEIGKNNVPSQFADDFYSALDNENFDPFYNLDDFGVLGRVNEVENIRNG